jgi:rhodanese-related sulfurtransferase
MMRLFNSSSKLVLLLATSRRLCQPVSAFISAVWSKNIVISTLPGESPISNPTPTTLCYLVSAASPHRNRLFSSFAGGDGEGQPQIQHIGKEQMEEIVEDYEEGGRDESGYVIIDVREPDEIAYTGKLSPNTHNVPLGVLAQYQVFSMDEDEFEEVCGFPKPDLDETLVFTCAAGIRSSHACQFAAMAGYSKLVNYRGGANEWFRG